MDDLESPRTVVRRAEESEGRGARGHLVSESRRSNAGYGVPVHPQWLHDLHVPPVAATPSARCVEYFPDDQVLNFRGLLSRQLNVVDGELLLHSGPGLGFEFDEEAPLPDTQPR
jgi:L-alanine-DL-glutamate epimerase-like enolase superfamily enzyme